jgi:hypothetical protein
VAVDSYSLAYRTSSNPALKRDSNLPPNLVDTSS